MDKLYLDIDGVLLGKDNPNSPEIVLARHAEPFLAFVTGHFSCFWLTTHCKGDTAGPLSYLEPYCTPATRAHLAKIRPTTFRTLKTEVFNEFERFWWIDDAPLRCEVEWLESRALFNNLIQVDTRRNPDDLLKAHEFLQGEIQPRG